MLTKGHKKATSCEVAFSFGAEIPMILLASPARNESAQAEKCQKSSRGFRNGGSLAREIGGSRVGVDREGGAVSVPDQTVKRLRAVERKRVDIQKILTIEIKVVSQVGLQEVCRDDEARG